MGKVRYESNTGCDNSVYEVEKELTPEQAIAWDLMHSLSEYEMCKIECDYTEGFDSDGNYYVELWECGGDGYEKWTVISE